MLSSGFDRAVRRKVLARNAHDNAQLSTEAALTFSQQMRAERGANVELEVSGQFEVGPNLVVFSRGPGSDRWETVLSLLRAKRGGKWKHLSIQDPDGTDVRFYYDGGRSPKTIRRETGTNK